VDERLEIEEAAANPLVLAAFEGVVGLADAADRLL